MKQFFPIIFKESQDWEYLVRHFFYLPQDGTIRQAVFVRNIEKELLALCAFDTGIFTGESREINLVYVHIRAVLPEYRNHHLGRIFSQKILTCLKPDMLMTTCVQLSSLYSYLFNRQRPGSFYTIESHSSGVDQWRISGKPENISTCFCVKSQEHL